MTTVVDSLISDIKEWKESVVKERGIGSDCAPSVFAFDERGEILGLGVLWESAEDRQDQFRRCVMALSLMREGWHAFGLAIVLEGYMQLSEDDGGGVSMAARFGAGDPNVVETISVMYGDVSGACVVRSMPYEQTVGRRVVWRADLERVVSDEAAGAYPFALRKVLSEGVERRWPEAVPVEMSMWSIASQLSDLGFAVAAPWLDDRWGEGL